MRRMAFAAGLLLVALLVVPASPVVDDAEAREVIYCVREPCNEPPCVIGDEGHCIVPIRCVRDPCF